VKKRIAVCGNGWNNEFLKIVLNGIRKCASEYGVDIYMFMNYSVREGVEYKDIGEANIYRLLDYGKVDGVILLANTFHLPEEFEYLTNKIKSENIPAISVEYQIPEIDFMGSDNYSGMYDLCNHIFNVHEVRKVAFVSGPEGHEECCSRRKALEDVMAVRGLSLTQDMIIYGDWNYVETVKRLPVWLEQQEEIPEAFICANDVMAMATCAVLKERNLRVPEDVIVTGFDHLESARKHVPKITTVDRNWQDMGYQSLKHLLDKLDGKATQNSVLIKSIGIPAKSCGCDYLEEKHDILYMDDNGVYDHIVNVVYWGGHLCDISESMVKVTKDEELHEWFNEFLVSEHQHEGEELYICLVDDFFSSIREGKPLRKRGYTDTVDVVCGIKEGKSFPRIQKMDITTMIPGYEPNDEESRLYLFLPLYDDEGNYGYVVFGNDIPMMYDYTLYNWLRNVKQSLSNVRQNMKLVELNKRLAKQSVTDGLTGVYNRMGCEGVAYPYLEKCHREGKQACLMFADINKMKVINDKYGHLQGDLAICTVAKVIRQVLSEEWIIVRYGGDEFLMVGVCDDDIEPQRLLDEIRIQLEKAACEMQLPYSLRAGVGYVMISPEESLNLSECLRKADEAMYQMKKKQHSEMKNK